LTLAVVTVAIPAALYLVIFNGSTSSYVPLSYGKLFTAEEQRSAEQSLMEAGLSQFRSEGRQILAPRNEVEKYNNALLQSGSLPANWAEELEKKLDKSNLFSTPDQLQAMKEAALAKELRRVIKAGPDFDDVSVVWTPVNQRRPRGARGSRVTATVNVKPRNGRELSQQQVRSLRAAVAGMIPDLSPSDVVVYDMVNYQSYAADKEGDAYDNGLISWIREHTRTYEDKIRDSLAFIPGVKVSVTVDVENLKRSVETSVKYDTKNSIPRFQSDVTRTESFSQAPVKAEPGQVSNQPLNLQTSATNQKSRETNDTQTTILNAPASTTIMKEYIPAFPTKVSVAVAIPEDYYKKALEKQSAEGGQAKKIDQLQAEVATTVKEMAARAIPNGNPEQISVSTFVQVDPDVPKIETSTLDTVNSLASQWGGTVGLAVFALWALMMLRKGMPKAPPEEPPMPAAMPTAGMPNLAPATTATINIGAMEEDTGPRETTERDLLQGMVRDNPEAAAAVLSKWLQAAK
ncbi:MAG: hypothetical protein AB7O26_17505, partial [Planctomycetaceae bacterium]